MSQLSNRSLRKGKARRPIVWAYVRVSSKDQNVARQIDAMHERGISDNHIVIDKASGKDFEREGWQLLMKKMQPGDTLTIQSLDRLGRSYQDLPNVWRELRSRRINIHVLDMECLSSKDNCTLEEDLVHKLLFYINSYVSEGERLRIKTRQKEGIMAAKARGVVFGRPKLPNPENYDNVFQQLLDRKITGRQAGKLIGMNPHTLYRRVRVYKKQLAEKVALEAEETSSAELATKKDIQRSVAGEELARIQLAMKTAVDSDANEVMDEAKEA